MRDKAYEFYDKLKELTKKYEDDTEICWYLPYGATFNYGMGYIVLRFTKGTKIISLVTPDDGGYSFWGDNNNIDKNFIDFGDELQKLSSLHDAQGKKIAQKYGLYMVAN
jgi:hypothetical protein